MFKMFMNSFTCIIALLNMNMPRDFLMNLLFQMETKDLKEYLKYGKVYESKSKHVKKGSSRNDSTWKNY